MSNIVWQPRHTVFDGSTDTFRILPADTKRVGVYFMPAEVQLILWPGGPLEFSIVAAPNNWMPVAYSDVQFPGLPQSEWWVRLTGFSTGQMFMAVAYIAGTKESINENSKSIRVKIRRR